MLTMNDPGLAGSFKGKLKPLFLFIGVTVVYLSSRIIIFRGFNGTDDLHYGMLAANVLRGTYSPFEMADIFSGRVLLVLTQAAIYFIGGVNPVTTQIGSCLITVCACYLTLFKLMPVNTGRSIVVASSLFYFNPVLTDATLGISPDVYVLFAGVLILLVLKSNHETPSKKETIKKGILSGCIILSALFFKETAIIFVPFLVGAGLYHRRTNGYLLAGAALVTFAAGVLLSGLWYYYYTKDFFFRVHQIQHSFYPNPCYYPSFFQKEMAIRLTYGVWKEFVMENFYPVLLASLALIFGSLFVPKKAPAKQPHSIYFLLLLCLGLYFPFSLGGYQPLCFKSRHFLFLLPLSVVVSTRFLEEVNTNRNVQLFRNIAATVLLGFCIKTSLSGWYWVFIRWFLAYYILLQFFINRRIAIKSYFLFAAILWMYLLYNLIFFNTTWYKDLHHLNKTLTGNYFYFPEHDNMMHWKLLHHFDTTVHIYNIEKTPFKVFKPYYEQLAFHPGWLVVNQQYTVRSKSFQQSIDSLQLHRFFLKELKTKSTHAYFIESHEQMNQLQLLMDREDTANCNCN